MKTKLDKNANRKLMLVGIVLIMLIGVIVIVSALTSEEQAALQNELSQLEYNLTSQGYGWLVDYNLTYPSVEVFRQDDNNVLATFTNISEENWHKIYLTNLSDNESYDVFDLKSVGNVEGISGDILKKKMRIDEIRKELNENGGNV